MKVGESWFWLAMHRLVSDGLMVEERFGCIIGLKSFHFPRVDFIVKERAEKFRKKCDDQFFGKFDFSTFKFGVETGSN